MTDGGADLSASWWMKVTRANKHLHDIQDWVARTTGPGARRIRIEKHRQGDGWIYTAHHDLVIDPMAAVTLGDFLFDLRSALDHIVAANVSEERRLKSQFPIFTEHIWETDTSGQYAKRFCNKRALWERWTKGVPPEVDAVIRSVQPYQVALDGSTNPHNHALAILNDFQNADKHRELTLISGGVESPEGFVIESDGSGHVLDYPGALPGFMMKDGANCWRSDREVDVHITGALKIAMACGPKLAHREIPSSLVTILDTVGETLATIQDVM